MPNIVIKDEYGTPEVFTNVNTVKFETPEGGYASFRYNEGITHVVPTAGYRVRFLDYDGFVIHEIYVDEGESVTPPPDPQREGLVFQGWNYTTEQLGYITSNVDVGAIYAAAPATSESDSTEARESTTTRIYVYVSDTDGSPTFSIQWTWEGSVGNRKMSVDWGDGSAPVETTVTSISKTLAPGNYIVTLNVINSNGEIDYRFGNPYGSTHCAYATKLELAGNAELNTYGCYYMQKLEDVRFKGSITSIPNNAFYNCGNLKKVVLPSSVISLGNNAFNGCKKLEDVVLPNAVTSIGNSCFYECGTLKSMNFPSSLVSIGESAFRYCYNIVSISLPPSLTEIKSGAFGSCPRIRHVTVPSSVTTLSDSIFSGCYWLESVTIPSGCTKIPSNMVNGCYNLRTISIPEGVTEIGNYSFRDCKALREVILPSTITNIGTYAFSGCESLFELSISAEIPPSLGSSAFNMSTNYGRILVPTGRADAYKAASGWSTYASIITESPY